MLPSSATVVIPAGGSGVPAPEPCECGAYPAGSPLCAHAEPDPALRARRMEIRVDSEVINPEPPAARAPRCRLLDRMSNRCPNPELAEGTGLCAHHLAEAHATYEGIIETATRLGVKARADAETIQRLVQVLSRAMASRQDDGS